MPKSLLQFNALWFKMKQPVNHDNSITFYNPKRLFNGNLVYFLVLPIFIMFVFFQVPENPAEMSSAPAESPDPEPALRKGVCLENDIGKWPEFMTPGDIDYCIKMGVTALQNCDGNLFDSKCLKQCDTGKGSEKIFTRKCQTSFLYVKDPKWRNHKTFVVMFFSQQWSCTVYCYCLLYTSRCV